MIPTIVRRAVSWMLTVGWIVLVLTAFGIVMGVTIYRTLSDVYIPPLPVILSVAVAVMVAISFYLSRSRH